LPVHLAIRFAGTSLAAAGSSGISTLTAIFPSIESLLVLDFVDDNTTGFRITIDRLQPCRVIAPNTTGLF
jgi:hypothetical protein